MWRDLRYALRLLSKSPGFTAVAVLTMALGIGPNTAVFSMVNAVLLRPLPYPHSDRLVMLWQTWKARGFDQLPVDGPSFLEWKQSSRSFEDMAPAFTIPEYGFNLTAGGEPERAQAAQCSANFMDVIGIRPMLGRNFSPDEDAAVGPHVVLLSHAFWQRRFGGDPSVLGRAIGLDGVSHIVVGVLPEGAAELVKVDLWVPIGRNLAADSRNNHNFGVMARLKPGITAAAAQREMDTIASRIEHEHPEDSGVGATVIPLPELVAGRLRPALLVLLAAVGLLLLIACANIAGLLLARGSARQREIAIRSAIGAGRSRVARQVLTESVALSAAGGVLGLALAYASVDAARSLVPDLLPRLQQMSIDGNVLAFTIGISVVTGVLFGLAPALRAARTDLNSVLKESGGRGSIAGGGARIRSAFLIAQMALSLVLLSGAGLLTRSFMRVTSVDPGFQAAGLLTMHVELPHAKYADDQKRIDFYRRLMDQIAAAPGVRSAAIITVLPMRGHILDLRISTSGFRIEGQALPPRGMEPTADFRSITPQFLNVMGIRLRAGRAFDSHDTADAKPVALINEMLARNYFAGQIPLGRKLIAGRAREIVGVVADVKLNGLEKNIEPAVYVPLEQSASDLFSIVVRGAGAPESLGASVRRAILTVDREQAVADVRSMQNVIDDSLLVRRLSAWLMAIFALLAAALAAIGIYGLAAYSVAQRTHEIGLRVALGAGAADVYRTVAGKSMAIAATGVGIGLPCAFLTSRLLGGMLFGVGPDDPIVFIATPALLMAIAVAAGYLPARRALRIDPTEALRYE